jgi:uncharacterized cofD-like protein
MTRKHLSSFRFWLMPGMGVKRHVALAAAGTVLLVLGVAALILWIFGGDRQTLSEPIENILVGDPWLRWGAWLAGLLTLAGLAVAVTAVRSLNRSLLSHWFPRPSDAAGVLYRELRLSRGPRIVALGGGTGLSLVLRGLRTHSSNLTAIVSVADDGGSSGRLRKAFHMPAPGDLSDCLAALSDRDQELGKLLQYRFERGEELQGHTFGNLLITTLTEVQGDFGLAIDTLNSLLNLDGRVYPASIEPVSLVAHKQDGAVVRGESAFRSVPGPICSVSLEPAGTKAFPQILPQLEQADVVLLGPGSLFTSTLPPLLVPEVRTALQVSGAPLVYLCNMMTEAGETDSFTAFDHVRVLKEHLGRYPDLVLINSRPVDPARLEAYRDEGAEPVQFDPEPFREAGVSWVLLELLAPGAQVRHDADLLADWLNAYARRTPSARARLRSRPFSAAARTADQ